MPYDAWNGFDAVADEHHHRDHLGHLRQGHPDRGRLRRGRHAEHLRQEPTYGGRTLHLDATERIHRDELGHRDHQALPDHRDELDHRGHQDHRDEHQDHQGRDEHPDHRDEHLGHRHRDEHQDLGRRGVREAVELADQRMNAVVREAAGWADQS